MTRMCLILEWHFASIIRSQRASLADSALGGGGAGSAGKSLFKSQDATQLVKARADTRFLINTSLVWLPPKLPPTKALVM